MLCLLFSCANAKKWEIELATLKNNNIRLTSALQVSNKISLHLLKLTEMYLLYILLIVFGLFLLKESTANVDEWKRQLHTYKEENIRLKRDMEQLCVGGGLVAAAGGGATEDELRREVATLKARTEQLQKELMQQELELKSANISLREKSNDQTVGKA